MRPTPSRVREALFSILGQDLRGLSVLDACAGMGMLGFEAISRGAAPVVFVERSPRVAALIRQSAAELGVPADVRVGELPQAYPRATFDLVFLDPPYALDPAPFVAAAPGHRVVLEHTCFRRPPEPPGWRLSDRRRYGDTSLAFYERLTAPRAGRADDPLP